MDRVAMRLRKKTALCFKNPHPCALPRCVASPGARASSRGGGGRPFLRNVLVMDSEGLFAAEGAPPLHQNQRDGVPDISRRQSLPT
jgi:hypothetical protein